MGCQSPSASEAGSNASTSSVRSIYTANTGDNNISAFQYQSDSGALSSLGQTDSGREPGEIAITPNGKYLYSANCADATVSAYSLGSTGDPHVISTYSTGSNPWGLAVSPGGERLYVANGNSNDGTNGLSVFQIAGNGALKAITSGISTTGPDLVA